MPDNSNTIDAPDPEAALLLDAPPSTPIPLLTLPPTIGHYRIIRRLGEGGMGTVYETEQGQPRRRVALKVIKAAWASPTKFRKALLKL